MTVEYIVNLASKAHLESVRLKDCGDGKTVGVLDRAGWPNLAHFVVSPAQAKKIRAKRGKLHVTESMIKAAYRTRCYAYPPRSGTQPGFLGMKGKRARRAR